MSAHKGLLVCVIEPAAPDKLSGMEIEAAGNFGIWIYGVNIAIANSPPPINEIYTLTIDDSSRFTEDIQIVTTLAKFGSPDSEIDSIVRGGRSDKAALGTGAYLISAPQNPILQPFFVPAKKFVTILQATPNRLAVISVHFIEVQEIGTD